MRKRLTKRQIVRRRRILALALCAAALVLVILLLVSLVRGVAGLLHREKKTNALNVTVQSIETPPDPYAELPWNLMLVSEAHPLPDGYARPAMAMVEGNWQVDSRIASAVTRMLDACRAEELAPMICSSYRSVEKQQELFDSRMDRSEDEGADDAYTAASEIVAIPGTSEHHTGLALDIVSEEYQLLDEGQENTDTYQWLIAHCAEYGFILRYPAGTTAVTGIIYEPWHFRYVGVDAAEEITRRGITLEEFVEERIEAARAEAAAAEEAERNKGFFSRFKKSA